MIPKRYIPFIIFINMFIWTCSVLSETPSGSFNGIISKFLPVPTKVKVESEVVDLEEGDYITSTKLSTGVEIQTDALIQGFIFYARLRNPGALFKPICIFNPQLEEGLIPLSASCATSELEPGTYEFFARTLGINGEVSLPSAVIIHQVADIVPQSDPSSRFICTGKPVYIHAPQPKVTVSREIFFDELKGENSGDYEIIRISWESVCFGYRNNDDRSKNISTGQIETFDLTRYIGYGSPKSYHVFFGNPFDRNVEQDLDPGLDADDIPGLTAALRLLNPEVWLKNYRTQKTHLLYKRLATVDGDTNTIKIRRPLEAGDKLCRIDELTGDGRFMLQNPPKEVWTVVADVREQPQLVSETQSKLKGGSGVIIDSFEVEK